MNRERERAAFAKLADGANLRGPARIAIDSRTSSAQFRRPELRRSYLIPVLEKAIRVIQVLSTSTRPLNVTEISRSTNIPKTTVYRILRTFSAYGLLPDGDEGVYHLEPVARLETVV